MGAAQRFFVPRVEGDRVAIEGDQARQIADVLRLRAGDAIVAVADGMEHELRLELVTRARVEGAVVGRHPCAAEPSIRLTLALPLLRGDRSEEVIEAVTQLGVSRIVPFTSERSVVRDLSVAKRARWERIARESAETARRGRIPEIAERVPWEELVDVLDAPVVIAWEEERTNPLRKAIPASPSALSLIVGPEGGLSAEEITFARGRGANVVSLGPRNLRSETAAIALVAQVIVLI